MSLWAIVYYVLRRPRPERRLFEVAVRYTSSGSGAATEVIIGD